MSVNKVLNKEEANQVSGGSVSAGLDGAAAIADGLTRVIESITGPVEGFTRPNVLKPGQSVCCSNSKRI